MTKRKTGPHKKTGRPTAYKPEYAEQARKLCNIGCTNEEVARFFGVTTPTIWSWKLRHPEFLSALRVGKDVSDERIVESLYHRALGYTYRDGNKKVQMPPDVTACIFWLKNRRPDLWRDKHDLTVAKAPTDNRTIMEQWYDLLRDMQAAGAIEITPDDPEYKVLGIANKPNGE